MTREDAIKILERVDICANAAETARDMAIAALRGELPLWATETAYKNGYEQGKKDALAKDKNVPSKWIPASEPPKEDGTYIVKTASGTVTTARFYAFKSFPATKHLPALHRSPQWQSNRNVVKWMPLPEGE